VFSLFKFSYFALVTAPWDTGSVVVKLHMVEVLYVLVGIVVILSSCPSLKLENNLNISKKTVE
jgi:hypothetical protein